MPKTPTITKRYFPNKLLQLFSKSSPGQFSDPVDEEVQETDAENILIRAGAVRECADHDDLCLDPSFERAWYKQINRVRETGDNRSRLANHLDINKNRISLEKLDMAFVAHVDGQHVGKWKSRAAFLADITGAKLLNQRLSMWKQLTTNEQSQVLGGLRLFLDICPSCGSSLSFDEETVESCCRSFPVAVVSCQNCGARIFETDHAPV